MRARLLFAERDFEPAMDDSVITADLLADVGFATMLEAMAAGDPLIRSVTRSVLVQPLTAPAHIGYRQQVLDDCLAHRATVRQIYDLAGEAIESERTVFRGYLVESPEPVLRRSVQVLQGFMAALRRLRRTADDVAAQFRSEGFLRFFTAVENELTDAYFLEIERHLRLLTFGDGLLVSARLGTGGRGVDFDLRRSNPKNRSLIGRAGLKKPTFSYTVPDGFGAQDELEELRNQALSEVSNAVAQSCSHVLGFFQALRTELAFYVGCINLHEQLTELGSTVCYPLPRPERTASWSARGLYDGCLALRLRSAVVGNTVDADGTALVVVTGANQGGKTTFLRSVGLAQVMMQAGMFVFATHFTATVRTGVFSHFRREEDDTMHSGKFDEELTRMSMLADHVAPGGLLLCNESFQSTNEREGSEVGRQVIQAMVDSGVSVFVVTHLFDLAHSLYELPPAAGAVFLRAERADDGERTFRVLPGEPLPTSFGLEVYDRIITDHPVAYAEPGDEPGSGPAR